MTTTYHGVLFPEATMATNIDSLQRSAVSASPIDNGNVVVLGVKSTTSGESEVFAATQPSSASPTGLWMAYSGDEIVVTEARYKGINPDARYFWNAENKIFSVYKPKVGDLIKLNDEAISGSYSAGSTTHINAVAGSYKLAWGTSQISGCTSYKLLGKTYISLATGAIDDQGIDAYEFECVAE